MKMSRFLIVAAVVVLQACTIQHVTDISMPPPGVRVGLVGAEAVALNVSVVDRRTDKTSIGTAQNKPSSGSSVIVQLRQPLDAGVRDAVEAEFSARGYRMGDGPVFLLVDIADARADVIYMLFRTRIEGNVSLRATVVDRAGHQRFERTFQRLIRVENSVIIGSWDEGVVELQKTMGDLIRDMAEEPALTQALLRKGTDG